MKTFATSILIRARPEAVWALLTDAPGYASWNSSVEKIAGNIALGEKVTVHAKLSPGQAFPVTVAEFEPARKMVWKGGMPLGLFTGVRTYTLSPSSPGEVQFAMREEFSGLLEPLITRSIPDLQPAFDTFAADLKRRAEAVV